MRPPHSKLLEKLALYGIDTAWFRSYLEGHTQQVRIPAAGQVTGSSRAGRVPATACQLSETRSVPIGVFQGGALSLPAVRQRPKPVCRPGRQHNSVCRRYTGVGERQEV